MTSLFIVSDIASFSPKPPIARNLVDLILPCPDFNCVNILSASALSRFSMSFINLNVSVKFFSAFCNT